MKNQLYLIAVIIFLVVIIPERCFSQVIPNGPYFGQTPPDSIPEVFAPGIISVTNRFEYCIGFSPDGKECAFGVTNSFWSDCNMYYTKQDSSGSWSPISLAYFQGNGDGWMPFFTYDSLKFFFSSSRLTNPMTANIWKCEKTDSVWSNPVKLGSPVNSSTHEWRPNTTIDETLYFVSQRSGGLGSADIYRSVLIDSVYLTVENIGTPVNSSSLEGTPFISPDEDYLIFESWKPGGYGQGDLYISFFKDSSWTVPVNMGPTINTNYIEDGAYVSPDGEYLFFNRRQNYVTSEATDIYWVDANIIEKLRPVSINPIAKVIPREYRLLQNYPNPFNPSTLIRFDIPRLSNVKISVYDVLGQEVVTLANEKLSAGSYEIDWDASGYTSGVYFYELIANEFVDMKKMVLLK